MSILFQLPEPVAEGFGPGAEPGWVDKEYNFPIDNGDELVVGSTYDAEGRCRASWAELVPFDDGEGDFGPPSRSLQAWSAA